MIYIVDFPFSWDETKSLQEDLKVLRSKAKRLHELDEEYIANIASPDHIEHMRVYNEMWYVKSEIVNIVRKWA